MAKVMIGGTFLDMIEHRKKAIEALVRLGHVPIAMDYPKSVDRNTLQNSLKMVEDCDAYLLIMSRRYGTIPDGESASLSELEYIRASELGKPRLVLAMSDDHLVKAVDIDTGKAAEDLTRFLAATKKDRVRSSYNNADHLGMLLIDALRSLPIDSSKPGNNATATEGPQPPRPWIVYPYTLMDSELVGRYGYIEVLDAWRRDPHCSTFVLHAIGGMGKSALSWQWFRQETGASDFTARWAGAFWWSFYEPRATFNNFVLKLHSYVSGKSVEELGKKGRPEREEDLRSLLATKPYLVVMDGFERELNAYGSSVSIRSEGVTQAVSPLKDDQATEDVSVDTMDRQTIDLYDGEFLQSIAEISVSKLLISSRLVPACLESSPGKARPRVTIEQLLGMKEDEAVNYWTSLGVAGSTAAVKQLVTSIEGYPLLIKALAGAVRDFKASPGNLDQWQLAHPQFDPFALPLKQRRTHVLQYALAKLSKQEWHVLTAIAAMRGPASYDFIKSWLVGPEHICKSEKVLIGFLSDLEIRGLIGWDRIANRYDMHPIVRNVIWAKVTIKDRSRIQSEMAEQFKTVASTSSLSSREELSVPIEIVRSLNDSGRFDEAWSIFEGRLSDFLHHSADRKTVRDLLSPMFEGVSGGKDKIVSRIKSSAAKERASLLLGYAEADSDDFANALALMQYHNGSCGSYVCRLHQLNILESCALYNSCERTIQSIMKGILEQKDLSADYSAAGALFYCLSYLIGFLVHRSAAEEAQAALKTLKTIVVNPSLLDPRTFAFFHVPEAQILAMLGCNSEALALYASIVQKLEGTEYSSMLFNAISAQFKINIEVSDLTLAADNLKRLLRLSHEVQSNSKWRAANWAHIKLLAESGRFDEAEDRLNSTEASIPASSLDDHAACLFLRGWLNEKEGRLDLARETAGKLIALYLSSGDTPRGLKDLEWAVKICDGQVPLNFPKPVTWPKAMIAGVWKESVRYR